VIKLKKNILFLFFLLFSVSVLASQSDPLTELVNHEDLHKYKEKPELLPLITMSKRIEFLIGVYNGNYNNVNHDLIYTMLPKVKRKLVQIKDALEKKAKDENITILLNQINNALDNHKEITVSTGNGDSDPQPNSNESNSVIKDDSIGVCHPKDL
jgi:hypothetical protein